MSHFIDLGHHRIKKGGRKGKGKKRKNARAGADDGGIPAWLCLTCGCDGSEGSSDGDAAHFEGRHSIGKPAQCRGTHRRGRSLDDHISSRFALHLPFPSTGLALPSLEVHCFKCDRRLRDDEGGDEADACVETIRRALAGRGVALSPASQTVAHNEGGNDGAETEAANESADAGAAIEDGAAAKASVVKGLYNLGNTCFFNSVMQCLAETR